MNKRLKLDNILRHIEGLNSIYYQPPENIKLTYPAIIYKLDSLRHNYASNSKYLKNSAYSITLIDKNPDSEIVDKLLELPMCELKQSYVKDNIYHYIFTIYV